MLLIQLLKMKLAKKSKIKHLCIYQGMLFIQSESEFEPVSVESEVIESIEPEEIEEVKAIITVGTGITLVSCKSAGTKDKPEDDVLEIVLMGA